MLFELDKNFSIKDIKFNTISMSDRPMFEEFYAKTPYDTNLWVMNFVYTIGFDESNSRKVLWKIVDGLLCVFVVNHNLENMFMLYPPCGKCDKKLFNRVVAKCMKIMLKVNDGSVEKSHIRTINQNHVDWLNSRYFKCKKSSFGYEHIYSCKEVAKMEGKKFEYIRRKFNKFTKEYPNAVWRRYVPTDWQSMMALKSAWEETAGEKYFRIIDASYYKGTIEHCETLKHDVFVVELNNRIIGMISGGMLSEEQKRCWCFLRKPLNNFDGLSEFLIVMLCREYADKADVLNDGADGGGGGLRFFKERFKGQENQVYECVLRDRSK